MSVGGQASTATINQSLTDLSVGLRNIMQAIGNMYAFVSASGGVTWLEGLGYSAADAQNIMTLYGYMNNLQAVYNGTGTQSSASDFNAAFAPLWAGQ